MDKKKRKYRWLKRSARVLGVLLLLFIVLILFIRSSWGQSIIVSEITEYISEKTKTKVEIDRLFITFSGNLLLEGLYLEDTKKDTLLYSKTLEANLPLSPLLFKNQINLRSVTWEGLRANFTRNEGSEKFNFDFLLDAFVSQDTVVSTTESKPLDINIGRIDFKDFNIRYTDRFLGIESQVQLGKLQLDANTTDVKAMRFELGALKLEDTKIVYKQTKPSEKIEDTAETQLPYLSISNFVITNVTANYNAIPDSISAAISLSEFQLKLPKADLSKNEIDIDLLALKNSTVSLRLPKTNITEDSTLVTTSSPFEWPEFLIKADEIVLENNTVNYSSGKSLTEKGRFNPHAIAISDLNLAANNLEYQPEQFVFDLDQFSFVEKSGFKLRNVSFLAFLDNSKASLSNLKISTNSSSINGAVILKYPSAEKLFKSPSKSIMDVQIPELELALQDVYFFQPELAKNEYLKKLVQHPFKGNLQAKGSLESVEIAAMKLNWGKNTSLKAIGKLRDVSKIDSLSFNLDAIQALSIREDILQFVSDKELGISIPQSVLLDAQFEGNLNDLNADVKLKIPEGNLQLTGNYRNKNQMYFDGNLKVDSLRLDKLLRNDQLGGLSFNMDINGGGKSLNTLNAEIVSDISQLDFHEYDFSKLKLNGKITNGKGDVDLNFKDENLNFTTKISIELDSIKSQINLNLNLIGADLYTLSLTDEKIRMGLQMKANFSGNPTDYQLRAQVSNGIAVYDNQQYQMGYIGLVTKIDSVKTDVSIDSDFLAGYLKSNASPKRIESALRQQFKNYFNDSTENVFAADSVQLNLDLKLHPIPILTDVFFRGIEQLDSIVVKADFDATSKKLNAEIRVPSVKYSGSTIDSLAILMRGDATNLNFVAGLSSLALEPIIVKKTYFNGHLKNKKLLLDFSSEDEGEKIVNIASEMTLKKDTIHLHINPEGLTFNKKVWSIPQNNEVVIAENFTAFENVNLSRNAQEMSISNAISGIEKEHFGITFDNFKLQTFISILNTDEALASGLVNGNFILENPFGARGIVADFKIGALEVLKNPLGNLSLIATSKDNSAYDFNLSVKDGGMDLDLEGDYAAAESGAKLNLDLDVNRIDLKFIEGFSDGAIKDSHGAISGKINFSGTTTAPEYNGEININAADFNVAALNSVFKISDEVLKIDSKGLYLNNFQITDANESSFNLDGSVLTKELLNPAFDLKLTTKKFRVLNSTKEDNELFYGMANFDADIWVKGNLKLPKVEGKLRIREVTNVTYVVTESQLDIEERDGVVIFVNRENTDAILTRKTDDESASFFQGMDVKAVIEIADDALFNVIIDEKTGDNLSVSGDADLTLNIEPNGRMNLSGRYELNSGHYETNLYNLVKRRFEINPGSTITWQGDPMDAKLDVIAVYEVETSASSLMSSVTSGQEESVTSKYRQVLPFMVYLNVDGQLLEPKLSFGLDMPESAKGSLGGAVYNRVQQLNLQEGELNKQVFSLLALNRFYPDSGSDGSSGGTVAIARDNVNKVLSGQLNAFSDKVFGSSGVEVDFDLDSFTDYEGHEPQDRTQLNINAQKKLFNERLIVTAGSAVDVEGSAQSGQEETPLIGNVSLEYLLTKDGRYRLKGFRKSTYENIFDGQLIVTGVALIFNKEFNKFSQLFNPLKDSSIEKEEDKEKRNEQLEVNKK